MAARIIVTDESDSRRNERFRDMRTGREMSRSEFVERIARGEYPAYPVRTVDGIKTLESNPDRSEKNNLS